MNKLPRETIDAEALDPNHTYFEHSRDYDNFIQDFPDLDESDDTPLNIFGGAVPSGPEELARWLQEYSNETGYVGRLYGHNVRPHKKEFPITLIIIAFILGCLLVAFLGWISSLSM